MRYSREESEFDRAIAFFDATFALALTLLVTTLDVSGNASVWESLGSLDDEVGSQFIAFAIAFALIAHYWLMHHRLVAGWTEIDNGVIVANLFLVATIVLLPFTTEAVGNPDLDQLELPTVIFALDVAAASILLAVIHWLAWKRELFGTRPSVSELRGNLMASGGPAVVFLVSIPIAYLVSPDAAKLSWLSLLVLSPLVGRRAASGRRAT